MRELHVTVWFCMARLAGSILVVRDGVQEVHCILEKDASVPSAGHAQE